ncbi:fatty acyl-CoA reductase wat-like [Drosophila novamexicana]|uniref:fatty acyl-CoA reductase wat-like n=1 Tax=Drosophila novamexicana TaxID=47314 RepID=UPI0011E5D2C4|nr:fatty acyl-CoA reductase wat-like [Drosophila novamexicana]
MESEIRKFYKNKTIFLTGGSGFLGKVIIEKLLRATDVKRIYLLIRSKRGKDTEDRFAQWKTSSLFDVLLKSKPNIFDRVVIITGDCKEPDLGISPTDRALLTQEVELVVHSAATVNFAEPLHVALDINARATRHMLQLAKDMQRLVAFVHVSTAFSNCVIHHIKERFYPEHLSCRVNKVLELRELLNTDLLDQMAPALLDRFPNTYTYTKALAEQLVQTEAGDLPVCIFRPGSIVATSKEPVPGWIDNFYGPIAVIYGAALGVLRVVPLNRQAISNIVPVDGCANLVLACAWRTAMEATQRKQQVIPAPVTIYNYVPSSENIIYYSDFTGAVEEKRDVFPMAQAIWYPFLHTTRMPWLFKLATIFYHLLPGYLVDLLLRLRGQKPRLIPIYKKIHKSLDVLQKFMIESWSFETPNTDRLWQSMSAADQQLFDFDMKSLDWQGYFDRALFGMRTYLGKEDPSEESIRLGLQKANRFLIMHRLLLFGLFCLGIAILRWLLCLFL